MPPTIRRAWIVFGLLAGAAAVPGAAERPAQDSQGGFRFRTGVELVNVTATVTDSTGRFVGHLRQEDFRVYEDEVEQAITHFSNERVPVSLGLALDTSGSMAGEKFGHARDALDRFLYDLLDPADEIFLYRFGNAPILVQQWTTDRDRLSGAIARIQPRGGTAMYDTVAEAVPMAATGQHRKKAVVIISDGNDTNSSIQVVELKQMIRETEVLVYAVGIDGTDAFTTGGYGPPRIPLPIPFPVPGRQRPRWPVPPPMGGGTTGGARPGGDRVNIAALREMTDDSGGRTEVVRSSRDLGPATANIAAELSKQYFLAYPAAAKKDGRWHSIRVAVRSPGYTVRARRGYIAN